MQNVEKFSKVAKSAFEIARDFLLYGAITIILTMFVMKLNGYKLVEDVNSEIQALRNDLKDKEIKNYVKNMISGVCPKGVEESYCENYLETKAERLDNLTPITIGELHGDMLKVIKDSYSGEYPGQKEVIAGFVNSSTLKEGQYGVFNNYIIALGIYNSFRSKVSYVAEYGSSNKSINDVGPNYLNIINSPFIFFVESINSYIGNIVDEKAIGNYTKTPLETLVEGGGDCEDLAVFLFMAFRHAGLDAVILDGPRHWVVGINIKEIKDTYFVSANDTGNLLQKTIDFKGEKYVPVEFSEPSLFEVLKSLSNLTKEDFDKRYKGFEGLSID